MGRLLRDLNGFGELRQVRAFGDQASAAAGVGPGGAERDPPPPVQHPSLVGLTGRRRWEVGQGDHGNRGPVASAEGRVRRRADAGREDQPNSHGTSTATASAGM